MSVNELLSKLHLPAVVTHFSWDAPKIYRKLPLYGWYALSKDENMTFNAIDLFRYNVATSPKYDDIGFIKECYRYYTQEHPDLFEVPVRYSETLENKITESYMRKVTFEKFYRACRAEALESNVIHHAKSFKFTKLLEDYGMTEFIKSGVGIITPRILHCKEFQLLCLENKINRDILLIPSFFAPNNKIASLEAATLGDLSVRNMIYLDREAGWYGHLGSSIVGALKDLLTVDGCTWNRKLSAWVNGETLKLHHSLQPNQCIEIWTNLDNLATDKNPLNLIDKPNLIEHIKDNLIGLKINQIRELEKITGQELASVWLAQKTSEATISGTRFISNNGRYYYLRGGIPVEFTNFTVELTRVKKEDGVFIQYGQVIMNGDAVPFKIPKKDLLLYRSLLRAIADFTLEAGLGIPMVAPNLKHYLPNVIEAFNPVNILEKPKPITNVIDTPERKLDDL